MPPEELPEVVPENPTIVTGGPLDPTSPEGQPPEVLPEVPAPSAYYNGLTGEIKTAEDLKTYTKNLEDLFVQSRAAQQVQQPNSYVPTIPVVPAVPSGPSAKDRYEELAFSKPGEAYELLKNEAKREMRQELDAEREKAESVKRFWSNFYEKHQDLKNFQDVVQSMVKAKSAKIALIKTDVECADFISRETRQLVDSVKKRVGVTEVSIPSQPAVALGGSKDVPSRVAQAPQGPLNFADQIRKLRPKTMAKK